jgi:hypothetical protein
MRNFSLGVNRRDLLLFAAAAVLGVLLTIVWDLFVEPMITGMAGDNAQQFNKYILTVLLLGLCVLVSVVSLGAARSEQRRDRRSLVAGLMVRFGIAMQLIGLIVTPIALYYATDPTRSVPIGFASFTLVLLGIFVAGFGGNALLPRRA